ncbi:MAG: hypothetical protein JXA52_06710, partial [Planctomycetes bacterium]|nr:hypothetical protein [Planctomycetota bacterium]
MPPERKHQKIRSAMESINQFKQQTEAPPPSPERARWRLDIPLWQLALEGMAAFIIAFVCGQGLGVFIQFLLGT